MALLYPTRNSILISLIPYLIADLLESDPPAHNVPADREARGALGAHGAHEALALPSFVPEWEQRRAAPADDGLACARDGRYQ